MNILNAIKNGKEVFYIGVKDHPEAVAALSLSEKVHFIDIKNPRIPNIEQKSLLVISQTTLARFEVRELCDKIKQVYKDAEFLDGICNASTKRQEALMNLNEDIDMVYIVGGLNSNNSKTLFNLAKELYPNKQVKLIQNSNDINKKDLLGLSHIAISSGASTPRAIINQIKSKLLD